MKDKYGQTPVDDNEADACHIFHLICKRYRLWARLEEREES